MQIQSELTFYCFQRIIATTAVYKNIRKFTNRHDLKQLIQKTKLTFSTHKSKTI